ncbi:MAG: GNAT family N-acetyltransferase [Candidatus Scalindua sediminis]|nr:GNAT family N-acetyltransferase [Candidatus Scalindua sediminis]HDY66738.1 GNAT family N-acetyltransferase [Candidatus Scalindua sp.]
MKYEIKKLEEREVVKAVELFNAIVDELHADSPVTERSHYKETYPVEEVKERLSNKDNVYLVGKLGKEIVSFMFAWASDGVGNIYWLGVKPKYRKKGYARKLMDETIKQFTKKSCHEARVFSYPKEKGAHKLFKSFGFEEKSFIDKQFFGISIILMERKLAPVPIKKIAKKIVLTGEAGQGIKLMAHTLANILAKIGKEVSLNLIYDAAVRGGEITAELIYSDEKIDTPFFDKADVGLCLSRSKKALINAKEIIIDEAACNKECTGCDIICPVSDRIPFAKISTEEFHSPVFVNMIALGRLLSIIGIKIEKVDFETEFRSRFLEENTRALKYGYTYRD